ncbi:IS4 family transposase [Paenibacillus xylanexedens]|uniref:IS4 family transposase n=1 Tax=Paenibacillus xylanexedens TaxID=528191 RepID=UPI003B014E48
MRIRCGRTLNRFIRTMQTLFSHPEASIAEASKNAAEAKAIYRLLQNPQLTEENVLESYRTETLRQMKQTEESVFLCVQDTTEIKYGNREKTPGLGAYNRKQTKGLLAHSALVLTPSGLPLGLLHQKIWARDLALKAERKVSRPYEQKESYKWTEAAKASVLGLPADMKLIHIGDREADFFEFLYHLHVDEQSYVVRSMQNRITEAEGLFMQDEVRKQPSSGQITVSLPRDTRSSEAARDTTLEIRFLTDMVHVPAHLKQKGAAYSPLPCTLIHALETTPLEGETPIEWFLLTNLTVATVDDAREKVAWYVQRWKIERFHYILKSGCEIEKLQERDGDRLRKLILFYSIIAVQLQQMTYLVRQKPDAPCTSFMGDEEWKVLYRVANKTKTLPSKPPTLRESVIALAKLGGFLGRKSDGDPGAKVLWRGLQAFRTILDNYLYLL